MIKTLKEWMEDENNRKQIFVIHGLMLLFYIFTFYVVCESGYSGDDIYNSCALGLKYIPGRGVWTTVANAYVEWLNVGRFFPFSEYCLLMFYYIPSRLGYKIAILVISYIVSVLFGMCINKVSGNRYMGYATMLLFPLCTQLTSDFDSALYSFHALIQMTFLWVLLSLWCIIKCVESEKKWAKIVTWILSGVFLFFALGSYEVAFVLAIFVGLAVWGYTGNFLRTLKLLIPDFIAYGVAVAINLYLRLNIHTVGYDGISINLEPIAVIKTFIIEITATFPLCRMLYWNSMVENAGISTYISNIRFTDVLMVLLFIAILVYIVKKLYKTLDNIKALLFLFLGGVSLMVLPAMLIAVSFMYQQTLDIGTGHLCLYVQSFGLILIVLSMLILIMRKCSKKASLIIITILAVISVPVMVLQEADARVSVEEKNEYYQRPVNNVSDAIHDGVLDMVGDEDILVGVSDYYYDVTNTEAFYARYAYRHINTIDNDVVKDKGDIYMRNLVNNGRLYITNSNYGGKDGVGNFVLAAKATGMTKDSSAIGYNFTADKVTVYVSGDKVSQVKYTDDSVNKSVKVDMSNARKTSKGYTIVELEGTNIDVKSVNLN